MITVLLVLLVLVSACVLIHGVGMMAGVRWLGHSWPRNASDFTMVRIFWLLVRLVYGLLILHLLQIFVWAAFYHYEGCFENLSTCFYYSATSYSTAGYGDVVLPDEWRILGSIEAVTGVLMFGWSTGVLFSVINHLASHFWQIRHDDPSKPPSPIPQAHHKP